MLGVLACPAGSAGAGLVVARWPAGAAVAVPLWLADSSSSARSASLALAGPVRGSAGGFCGDAAVRVVLGVIAAAAGSGALVADSALDEPGLEAEAADTSVSGSAAAPGC